MYRILLVACMVLVMAGCKLHVIALQGGEVQSVSSGTCLEHTNCVHDINQVTYNESFTAVPANGYVFVKWHGPDSSHRFLCVNSTNPTCVVDLNPLRDLLTDADVAAFGNVFLMPIFREQASETPVDCIVGPFEEWSQCSASCGDGTQTRTRPVLQEPANGGEACPALTETRLCNLGDCPLHCQFSQWSVWSACSAACGGGTQYRTRTVPPDSDERCDAFLVQTQACNTQPCDAIDCQVSAWSEWSDCSAVCDGGERSRTRSVIQPPQNGGADCPSLEQTEACNTQPCS